LGLLLTDTEFGFMAMLGFLSLSGMLLKNAIVLVEQIDVERASGKPGFEAILDSGVARFRPVVLAALTTILGMLPLLGDVFFRGMAVVIMFGLLVATALTLLVAPTLYSLFFRIPTREKSPRNQTGP
jgi:multidrug efflux pump subunit AcrB